MDPDLEPEQPEPETTSSAFSFLSTGTTEEDSSFLSSIINNNSNNNDNNTVGDASNSSSSFSFLQSPVDSQTNNIDNNNNDDVDAVVVSGGGFGAGSGFSFLASAHDSADFPAETLNFQEHSSNNNNNNNNDNNNNNNNATVSSGFSFLSAEPHTPSHTTNTEPDLLGAVISPSQDIKLSKIAQPKQVPFLLYFILLYLKNCFFNVILPLIFLPHFSLTVC